MIVSPDFPQLLPIQMEPIEIAVAQSARRGAGWPAPD